MAKLLVPKEVSEVALALAKAGFEAYLVGGCVRDMLLGREPKDWDIATSALPEDIQKFFPESVYENAFGTVGVKTESEDPKLKVIEVTTYRIEGRYTDKRHPDEVKFAKTIQEDLSRRDFTVNALAMNLKGEVYDPFGGKGDLEKKVIRTVGSPAERFSEDALRLMRAVRFAVELDFEIEMDTRRAIEKLSHELEMIAKERVRDELVKILETPQAAKGMILLEELGLLQYVLPELREGLGVGQNLHHIYTVFEHSVRSLDYAAKQDYPLVIRMAALLHDVGKPRAKQGEGRNSTFYQHEFISAKMTTKALDRLRFSKEFIEQVTHLVRYHMFYYNVGEVSERGVRRFLARVGPETVPDLFKVREADRIGSGAPKATPYKNRHLMFMIEKVKNDPVSPKMLKVNGDDVMEILKIPPGQRVGWVLAILLEEVLDDPKKNVKENLTVRVTELGKLSDAALKKLAEKARTTKDEFEEGLEEEIKKKYFVK
ncbi:MAG: HD domain-containing protein [Minisyncoccia bacterium]|jgi:poly(A) polymerase/tRNA nucleotidyltransferase (CCA-adding enzyme)